MTHNLSNRIETRLSTDRVLASLQMSAGWKDKAGRQHDAAHYAHYAPFLCWFLWR